MDSPRSNSTSQSLAEGDDGEKSRTITINVHPTTGGQFEIELSSDDTAEELKRRISRRLHTPKERLKLLHREQVLETRPLKEYNISDGSKVTLLPSVESGFSSAVQGTQQSIIQAIESLSDAQIDDFLSGRLPLTLALRVGDHMMFVQLQLEQSQICAQPSSADAMSSKAISSVPIPQLTQSMASCISPRIFSDSLRDVSVPPAMAATALLQKPHGEFSSEKSQSETTNAAVAADPLLAGPSPKVPKLTSRGRIYEKTRTDHPEDASGSSTTACKSQHSFHYTTPHPHRSRDAAAAAFEPSYEILRQITSHCQHLSMHEKHRQIQESTNHLHQLVTACSSLGDTVAIPQPSGGQLKVPIQEANVKSSRKRSSTAIGHVDEESPVLSQKSTFTNSVGATPYPTPAEIIQNALLRHHHLSGFPPPPSASLIPSAYAKYKSSSQSCRANPPPSSPSSAASSPTELRLMHPITSTMLQTASNGERNSVSKPHRTSGRSSHYHGHKRSSASTSGKISSSSISSHHASGISGARVARQMQRLRRLCGSHQQCVAYSNRELATEISSIVHMAKHSHHGHSRSEGSHRKSHKVCRECHGRERPSVPSSAPSTSSRSPSTPANVGHATGACIDSFTTHGPGIFSGTFSGSLHPSIQDGEGKPKRDPKTILQILTDLLNATQQYQGQIGNVGLLPQLFRDHFKTEEADKDGSIATQKPESAGMGRKATTKEGNKEQAGSSMKLGEAHSTRAAFDHSYILPPNAYIPMPLDSKSAKCAPSPASYLSSVSTIPLGNIPASAYSGRHRDQFVAPRSSRKSSSGAGPDGKQCHHQLARCHHHHRHQHCATSGLDKMRHPNVAVSSRRHSKSHMLNSAYVKRLKQLQHENNTTRNKMKELKQSMERKRYRRQFRKHASKLYNRRNPADSSDSKSTLTTNQIILQGSVTTNGDDSATPSSIEGSKMEVQFDDIKDFEIKEVAHEPPETVTV